MISRGYQPRRGVRVLLPLMLMLALVAAACGGGESTDEGTEATAEGTPAETDTPDSTGTAAEGTSAAADALPQDVKDRGYVVAAGDATYPPIGLVNEDGEIVGSDPDFAKALGEVLGIEFRYEAVPFDSIIPGLDAERYDLGLSWFNYTEERQEIVDFVLYGRDGSSIVVPADAESKPASLEDLCGSTVAVQAGAVQVDDAEEQRAKCEEAGDEPLEVLTFADQTEATLALGSGRANVTLVDTPVAAWIVSESDGNLELSGEPYGLVYHGIVFPKESELTEPIALAMQELMDDGTYQRILDEWNMGDAAIDEVLINEEPLS